MQVTRDKFYEVIGPMDAVVEATGEYPYTSVFTTRTGSILGKIAPTGEEDQFFYELKSGLCQKFKAGDRVKTEYGLGTVEVIEDVRWGDQKEWGLYRYGVKQDTWPVGKPQVTDNVLFFGENYLHADP